MAAYDDQPLRMASARKPGNDVEGRCAGTVAVNKRIEPDLQAWDGAVLAEDPVPRSVYAASGGRGGRTAVTRSKRLQREYAGLYPACIYAVHNSAYGWIGLHPVVCVHQCAGKQHAYGYNTAQKDSLHRFGPFLTRTRRCGQTGGLAASGVKRSWLGCRMSEPNGRKAQGCARINGFLLYSDFVKLAREIAFICGRWQAPDTHSHWP